MEGKVEKIWENEKNAKKYWVMAIDGGRYSVWDEKYINGISEGSTVDYKWKKSGNFRKIIDTKKLHVQPLERKSEQIIRMSCLRSASEIIAGLELEPKEKADLALDISKTFQKYVINGDK